MRRSSTSAAPAIGWSPSCKRNGAPPQASSTACWRSATAAGSSFTRCPAPFPKADADRRARREGDAAGGARRDPRRHPAQPDALRVSDPGVEGAAPSRAGGRSARSARSDALAYTAGSGRRHRRARRGVCSRSARRGREAGWAFQLQDPRTIMLLLLLAVAITANLLGLFELPVLGGAAQPAGSFGTGALAAFVATPCAGPFLGAALGTALLLPPAGSVLVFAALGLGLGAAVPAHRARSGASDRLAEARPVDEAAAALSRDPDGRERGRGIVAARPAGGQRGLVVGCSRSRRLPPAHLVRLCAARATRSDGSAILRAFALVVGILAMWQVPSARPRAPSVAGAEPWSEARVASYVAAGQAGVRLFHRRLVPDLQGQRGSGDRPRRGARRVPRRPA